MCQKPQYSSNKVLKELLHGKPKPLTRISCSATKKLFLWLRSKGRESMSRNVQGHGKLILVHYEKGCQRLFERLYLHLLVFMIFRVKFCCLNLLFYFALHRMHVSLMRSFRILIRKVLGIYLTLVFCTGFISL